MDWKALGLQALSALVPIVTVVVVYYVKLLVPKIPRVALPIVAALLPMGVAFFTNYIAGHTFDPFVALLLGAAATWLREVVNTLNEHGAAA